MSAQNQATTTTIKKLPPIREDVPGMKLRIQELEAQVLQYKTRLDELRKAKNNLIIKKTTEYVNTGTPALGTGGKKDKPDGPEGTSIDEGPRYNGQYIEELETVIDNLNAELSESKNLTAALRVQNEELVHKIEEYKREIAQWENMYKEWMSSMESRVDNINRTHKILQKIIVPGQEPQQQQEQLQQQQPRSSIQQQTNEDSDVEEVERPNVPPRSKQQQQQNPKNN